MTNYWIDWSDIYQSNMFFFPKLSLVRRLISLTNNNSNMKLRRYHRSLSIVHICGRHALVGWILVWHSKLIETSMWVIDDKGLRAAYAWYICMLSGPESSIKCSDLLVSNFSYGPGILKAWRTNLSGAPSRSKKKVLLTFPMFLKSPTHIQRSQKDRES